MNEIKISKNILMLRKKKGITQEELAKALNVSNQAISKWETEVCQPDILILPLIAKYFNVSIDYLFYGEDMVYEEIYDKIYDKVIAFNQMSKKAYKEVQKIMENAHKGLGRWNKKMEINCPNIISCENGIAVQYNKEYGIILLRELFASFDIDTFNIAHKIFNVLSDKNNSLVLLAIMSMDDISDNELKEKVNINNNELNVSLNKLIDDNIIIKKESKHKVLGNTYSIKEQEYICLCTIYSAIYILQVGLRDGICCNLGYADFPISIN